MFCHLTQSCQHSKLFLTCTFSHFTCVQFVPTTSFRLCDYDLGSRYILQQPLEKNVIKPCFPMAMLLPLPTLPQSRSQVQCLLDAPVLFGVALPEAETLLSTVLLGYTPVTQAGLCRYADDVIVSSYTMTQYWYYIIHRVCRTSNTFQG